MKNKKHFLAGILLGAVIISATAMSGCGNNTGSNEPVTTAAPATTVAPVITEAPTTIISTEPKILEELVLSDEKAGDVWEYKDDTCSIIISAGYCKETDIVYDITFNMDINKNYSDFNSFTTEMQSYEDLIKSLNDPKLFGSFKETSDGATFAADFNGLELADRAERIKLAQEIIGLTANNSDTAFHFSEIDAELKANGIQ